MQKNKSNLLLLVQRIFLLLVFYTLCRLIFLFFNLNYFHELSVHSLLRDFFIGLRFDLTAIVISNIIFIALHFYPFSLFYHKNFQRVLKALFIVVNIPLLLFSSIDFGFFRFSAKHATSEDFKAMSYGEDFINTLPSMILDFWYVLLIYLLLSLLLIRGYNKIKTVKHSDIEENKSSKVSLKKIIVSLAFIYLVVIGFRGGFQYKPISIITASQYGSSKDVALILNTPFTIIKSIGKTRLNELSFFPKEKAEILSPVNHVFKTGNTFRKQNVVIIILESFGKEYIGSMNHYKGYTPFLDSLCKESLVFTNAFANGKRSIEGIPAVVAGIPSLMGDPFITSVYSGNSVSSLASILKTKGYKSSFFHGGTNGTMGFDSFIHLSGFDLYYGRREYKNEKDFDGSWGIYDEPFLQKFAEQLNEMSQPFFSTVFTLSSHHPYAIPPAEKNKFQKGTLPIHQSILYADYSLKKFFETASKMPFFDSTLFVITADHTALSEYPFYQSKVGMYSIPIIFYKPNSDLKGVSQITTQQIDILPSILDYLNYDEPFFSFGTSVFDSTDDRIAVNYLNDTYQVLSGNYSLSLDTLKNNSLYHYTKDSLLVNNLLDTDTVIAFKMEKKLKAFIQNYNDAMIKNRMTIGSTQPAINLK